MTPGLRHSLVAGVTCAAAVVLYVSALDVSPVYLLNDEIVGALQAISLASTGRSLSGEWFQVFFRGLEFPPGRDPLFVYATAAVFKLIGVSEVTLRVPTALVGVACIVVTYFVGRRLWGTATYGLLAAVGLALTPAFFINSRIGIPTLWSTPWILGWLLGLAIYVERAQPRALFAATLTAQELAERETTSPAFFIAGIDDVPKMGRPLPSPWRLRTYIFAIDGPSFYVVFQR